VAAYDVADRAAFSIVYTANTMAEALAPRMAAHLAGDDTEGALKTYSGAAGVFCVAAMSMATFAAFQSSSILRVWLGNASGQSVLALAVLAIGYGVGVSLSAAHLVATAQAAPTMAMRYSIALAVGNSALSLVGAWLGGVVGAACGSALSGAVSAVLFSIAVERRILFDKGYIGLRALIRSALITVPPAAGLAFATSFVAEGLLPGRVAGLMLLGVAFVAQIAVTTALSVKMGLVPASALHKLRRTIIPGRWSAPQA